MQTHWTPLSQAAPLLGVSRQTLWRRLDTLVSNEGWRRPGAPQPNVHWRYDGRRYLVDVAKISQMEGYVNPSQQGAVPPAPAPF